MYKFFFVSFSLLFISCRTEINKETSATFNKSLTLNSTNKKNIDSLFLLKPENYATTTKDSVTLLTTTEHFLSLHFENENSWVTLKFIGIGGADLEFWAKDIGCTGPNSSIIFIKNDNPVLVEAKLLQDEIICDSTQFGATLIPAVEKKLFTTLGDLYAVQLDKIRIIKNDSTFVDLILNESDKKEIELFFKGAKSIYE